LRGAQKGGGCVSGLWTGPRVADWVWVTLGSAAMLILHVTMLAEPAAPGSTAHPHGPPVIDAAPLGVLAALGLALPLAGLALAWFALGGRSLRVGIAVHDQRADRRPDG
jgi:hypothetical protein